MLSAKRARTRCSVQAARSSLDCSDIMRGTYLCGCALLWADAVLTSFAQGEVSEIWLAYTAFKNTVVHEPRLIRLLPVSKAGRELKRWNGRILQDCKASLMNL